MDDVLILKGVPDNNRSTVLVNRGALFNLLLYMTGTNDLHNLINKNKVSFREVTLGEKEPGVNSVDPLRLVLSTISDPDSNKNALR